MTIEQKLQDYILEKYDSVNQFCNESGISSSTLFTIFKRGIRNSTTTTILRICSALGLDAQSLYDGKIKLAKLSPELENATIDIIQYIQQLESMKVTFKGKILTDEQKELIITTAQIAVQTAIKKY